MLINILGLKTIDQRTLSLWRFSFCFLCAFLLAYDTYSSQYHIGIAANELFQPNFLGLKIFKPLANDIFVLLSKVFFIFLIFSAIGLFTQFSLLISALLGLYLGSITFSYGGWNHSGCSTEICLLCLSMVKCNQFWSIDSFIMKKRGYYFNNNLTSMSPIIIGRWCLCLLFFFAGLKKITYSMNLDWITSDSLANTLYWVYNPKYENLLQTIAGNPWLYKTLAAGVVIFEITAPLAMFLKKYQYFFAFAQLLFLISACVFLKELFYGIYPLLLCWLPWEKFSSVKSKPLTCKEKGLKKI